MKFQGEIKYKITGKKKENQGERGTKREEKKLIAQINNKVASYSKLNKSTKTTYKMDQLDNKNNRIIYITK